MDENCDRDRVQSGGMALLIEREGTENWDWAQTGGCAYLQIWAYRQGLTVISLYYSYTVQCCLVSLLACLQLLPQCE